MSPYPTPRLRFAPSPNGLLHVGHAYSAWINKNWANALSGDCLLRIEDIDTARCTPANVQAMHDDLTWLGMTFEGEVIRQSSRMEHYDQALRRLATMGLVYAAPASRRQIADAVDEASPRDPDGAPHYPFAERDRANIIGPSDPWPEDTPIRLNMDAALQSVGTDLLMWQSLAAPNAKPTSHQATPARWGDVILRRKDTPTSYHLSVVVDDAAQEITYVVRGQDLEAATDLHALLQKLLGLPTPLYHHHALIADDAGLKLSKSKGAPSLKDMREAGADPQDILRRFKGIKG